MKYSSRFFLYAPLALFLLLAAGVGIVWWREAQALSERLDALNGHEAVPGVTLSFASKSIGGFPFNLDVVFNDLRLTVQTPHGPASWRSEKFALHALTYGRAQAIVEATGRQMASWSDLNGHPHTMPFAFGELHASTVDDGRGLARFDLECFGLISPALTAGRIEFHVRRAPDGGTLEIAAEGDAIRLAPGLGGLLGRDINSVKLNAAAAPLSVFDGLRGGQMGWVAALERFRAANGRLAVNSLEIAWPRLSAMGKGALSLDAAHRVEGLLDFKVAGIQTLLAAAAQRNVRGGPDNGIGPALLDRAAAAGNNEAGLLGVVVSFHGGTVSAGADAATTEEPLY